MKFFKDVKTETNYTLDKIHAGTPFYHTTYDKSGATTELFMKTNKIEDKKHIMVVRLTDGYVTSMPSDTPIDPADIYMIDPKEM